GGMWLISSCHDIASNSLKVIQPELLRNQDVPNRLLVFIYPECNADHNHSRRREGVDTFVHRLLRPTYSPRSHFRERHEGTCIVDFAQVKIDPIADGFGFRILAHNFSKGIHYCPAFYFGNCHDENIGFEDHGGGFFNRTRWIRRRRTLWIML